MNVMIRFQNRKSKKEDGNKKLIWTKLEMRRL
jgi:hypothetical protein